ncbi:MAG: CTP synthase [Proteocatella sp.]
MAKFIFVTGGVVSGLGKGITAASLGRLLKSRGYKIAAQKLDPYINIDPGTMNPCQHGEVFVTEDGAETDLDLGHYERFIDEDLNKFSNLTTGKVYWNVLNRERRGDYLGETIQVIPHITNEIKDFIYNASKKAEVLITEIGGTIGDIESQPFLEAIRQISLEVGKENCLFIHVTLVPYLRASNEHKSKPTQHSVKEMRSLGLNPDIIVMRSDEPIEESIKQKISLFCNVKEDCVIENHTIDNLYEAPLMLEDQKFSEIVCRELLLPLNNINIEEWANMCKKAKNPSKQVKIGIVGKYIKLQDSYISVVESLKHAAVENDAELDIAWIEAEDITEDNTKILSELDGILVPGGFGDRGVEGKILACKYARENNIPYFGICLGMQIAAVEYARNVLGYESANSTEFDSENKYPIIDFMPDQNESMEKGGTMRLGAYPCSILENTIMARAYGESLIHERHRHRYEFNNVFREEFEKNGIVFSGTSPDKKLVEAIEIPKNKFFIGVQYHPEFKSRPNKAHPIFREFVKASIK